jgi:2,3-diaminopropionate biosynthesis protein SbnB
MLYLSEQHLVDLGVDWDATIGAIASAARTVAAGDFAQPIKPYLRYRDPRNRIIAMPAFLGGDTDSAGIKWIASFPGNLDRGLPRAHSVVIVNDAATGEPRAIINTPLLSVVRTASVTGVVLKRVRAVRGGKPVQVGITGWGPIGQYHARMCAAVLGADLARLRIYDPRPVRAESLAALGCDATVARSWQEAYDDADVFITCTVSSAPYIDRRPKPGSLQLNVSLRDYRTEVFPWVRDGIVVDDWDEVCRESTDIETLHRECGLERAETRSLFQLLDDDAWLAARPADAVVMFNPMGMAVFDLAIAAHYTRAARAARLGVELP